MRCCDSLPPISPRFVSFAWRYHRCVRGSSPPAPDAEPWINRELVGGISSRLARWKRQGLPSSRRNPRDHSPYSSDPGVTRQAEWTMSKLPGAAPATDHDEGSPRVLISGLNRTAFDLAVYASQGWLPTHHARLASGCWSGSTGRDWLPARFHLKGFKLPTILLSRAFLARGQTEFQVNLKLGLTPCTRMHPDPMHPETRSDPMHPGRSVPNERSLAGLRPLPSSPGGPAFTCAELSTAGSYAGASRDAVSLSDQSSRTRPRRSGRTCTWDSSAASVTSPSRTTCSSVPMSRSPTGALSTALIGSTSPSANSRVRGLGLPSAAIAGSANTQPSWPML